ncbi:squalene/phytoene synthase family protein [Leptolyngbyaceae cyanobacterium UHCC 1019]
MKHITALHTPWASSISLQAGIIADLVGSSNYHAISDDTLKDEDNAGWVMELDLPVRAQWIERIHWIRLIDRLAEHELLYPEQPAFQRFLADWQHLELTGEVQPKSADAELFSKMRSCWFNSPTDRASIELSLAAWKRYVQAIAQYHTHDLVIHTMAEYEQMLTNLGGSFFQVLPFLSETQHQAAHYFGRVDQFYNHLRDLREDAEQGVCNLPNELLEQFGVSRDEILQQQAINNPGYPKMMQFWLEQYLPTLRRRAHQLLTVENLHPSWQILYHWSNYRYQRIDRVFRDCQFDYTQFSQVYWQQVRADLPIMLHHVRQHSAQSLPLKFPPLKISASSTHSTYRQRMRLRKTGLYAA